MTSVMWFRRDLRLNDNPALLDAVCAAQSGSSGRNQVVPLFVLDPAVSGPAGVSRRSYLTASLRDLSSRVAVCRVAWVGDEADRIAIPGVHAVLPCLARARLAAACGGTGSGPLVATSGEPAAGRRLAARGACAA